MLYVGLDGLDGSQTICTARAPLSGANNMLLWLRGGVYKFKYVGFEVQMIWINYACNDCDKFQGIF